jgi:hypothetical protein
MKLSQRRVMVGDIELEQRFQNVAEVERRAHVERVALEED